MDDDPSRPTPATRWPAEWEPHAATWLAWPHNPDTWPGRLEAARREYAEIVRALQGREAVRILVADAAMEASARAQLRDAGIDPDRGLAFPHVPTNDAWIRDYGPVFVEERGEEGAPRRRARKFGFDAWGGKYPPWDLDDAAAERALADRETPLDRADFVLEGGSVDGNGRGVVLTTESCLLDPKREPGRRREQMEARLARWLGAERVVWLFDGIEGDDTDGHVDDLSRFVAPSTVVTALAPDPSHPDHAVLAENHRRLRTARDHRGRPLEVVTLPVPPIHRVGGALCPASYANFYLANGAALVPTFGVDADAKALAVLREVLPGRDVVAIPCRTLVAGLGAVHCLTQQEPAGRAP